MSGAITIIETSERIEHLLRPYREAIGRDYVGYRNHCLRVLTYTMHFLDGDERWRALMETALAYHDLGMWSDHDLAYLEPSITHALADNAKYAWGYDPELLTALIAGHHKLTPYRGRDERLVNAMRKADWIDASGGMLRKGLSKAQVAAVTDRIPVEGFPQTLMRLASDLAGGNRMKGLTRVLTHVYRI